VGVVNAGEEYAAFCTFPDGIELRAYGPSDELANMHLFMLMEEALRNLGDEVGVTQAGLGRVCQRR
jgi:hypothetical protein